MEIFPLIPTFEKPLDKMSSFEWPDPAGEFNLRTNCISTLLQSARRPLGNVLSADKIRIVAIRDKTKMIKPKLDLNCALAVMLVII